MMKLLVGSKKVEIEIYDKCKYEKDSQVKHIQRYDNVKGFEVVTRDKAKEIEDKSDGSCIDDNHEYLILHFETGETATFRNSYVDMFHV